MAQTNCFPWFSGLVSADDFARSVVGEEAAVDSGKSVISEPVTKKYESKRTIEFKISLNPFAKKGSVSIPGLI
jgi:hypothetical protein